MGYKIDSFTRRLRIIELLEHKEYTSAELEQQIYGTLAGKHDRVIQLDLDKIAVYYGERYRRVKKGKEYYYSLLGLPARWSDEGKSSGHIWSDVDVNDPEEISKLYDFLVLFDSDALALFEEDRPVLIGALRKEMKEIYSFIHQPFEYLPDTKYEYIQAMKSAIKKQRYVNIGYQKEELIAYNKVKPLKIVYAQNNWYLACLIHKKSQKSYSFTYLRVSLISSIEVLRQEYKHIKEVEKALAHIQNPQSLFSLMDKEPYKVELLAQRSIAYYFKKKKYLESQQIEEHSDGSITVSYSVTTDKEILPIIKKWLPDIYVLKPKRLQISLSKMLHRYLTRVDDMQNKKS